MRADVRDRRTVAAAVEGAEGVVNAVSAYVEKGGITFEAIHVEGARCVAEACARAGVGSLVQISGIGADSASRSRYIRARGRGEHAVREAFPQATILRPSVLFGEGGGLLESLAAAVRRAPVFALIGGGETDLQPVHVADVAEAAVRALSDPDARGRIYELGGPRVCTLRALVEHVMDATGGRRPFVPLPFAMAETTARVLEALPSPPLTVAQVELLRRDNVVSGDLPGFAALGITPRDIEEALPGTGAGDPQEG